MAGERGELPEGPSLGRNHGNIPYYTIVSYKIPNFPFSIVPSSLQYSYCIDIYTIGILEGGGDNRKWKRWVFCKIRKERRAREKQGRRVRLSESVKPLNAIVYFIQYIVDKLSPNVCSNSLFQQK